MKAEGSTGVVFLTEGLLARGYTDDDVRNILGLNWLRVYGAVWGA